MRKVNNEKDLLALKEEIDNAEEQLAKLKGRRDYIMKEILHDKWNCSDIKQAKQLIHKRTLDTRQMENSITKLRKNIEGLLNDDTH